MQGYETSSCTARKLVCGNLMCAALSPPNVCAAAVSPSAPAVTAGSKVAKVKRSLEEALKAHSYNSKEEGLLLGLYDRRVSRWSTSGRSLAG